LGGAELVAVEGQTEAFIWSYGPMSQITVRSAQGDATTITNMKASSVTVSAHRNALLASLGEQLSGFNITAGDLDTVLGRGVFGILVTAGGDLHVLSYGPLSLLNFTAGRDTLLQSTDQLTAIGYTGRDLQIYTYGSVVGSTITAGDDLTIVALGTIDGIFQAADNVELVVTYGSLSADITAGSAANPAADTDPDDGYGNIRRVYVWNDLDGTLTAFDTIGEVYVGNSLAPGASLNAPTIGLVALHDRSPFVEEPLPALVRLGEVITLTKEAYRQLQELAQQFLAARREVRQ
jgi:hypothetical protein